MPTRRNRTRSGHEPQSTLPDALVATLENADAMGAFPDGVAIRDRESGEWLALVVGRGKPGTEIWRLAFIQARGVQATVTDGGPVWTVPAGLFRQVFGQVPDLEAVWRWDCDGRAWMATADGLWTEIPPDRPPPVDFAPDWMLVLDEAALDPGRLRDTHYPDDSHEWFTTPHWDTRLYAAAARAGLISISWQPGLDTWLLAQLQTAYALLDWDNRHMPGRLRRQLRQSHPLLTASRLVLTDRLGPVMEGIRRRYGPDCWLRQPYARLMQEMVERPVAGFRPLAVELRGADGALLAGELGYAIGATYTCLSGYVAPDAPAGVSWGTVQILALSQLLRQQGFAFMNMGHTEPPYKLELGARVLPRADFLARWLPAVQEAAPDLALEQAVPAAALLAELGGNAAPGARQGPGGTAGVRGEAPDGRAAARTPE